jgi:hypothetical protein
MKCEDIFKVDGMLYSSNKKKISDGYFCMLSSNLMWDVFHNRIRLLYVFLIFCCWGQFYNYFFLLFFW